METSQSLVAEPSLGADGAPQIVDVDARFPQGPPCEACGAPSEPADRFCAACGSPRQPASVAMAADADDSSADVPQRFFRCKNCGSEVATDVHQRSYQCAFCDSNYVTEYSPEGTERHPPEFIIGFAVTPDEAQRKFRQWIGTKGWFRPSDLHMARIEGKLKGVYLPFWSFSMLAQSQWSCRIGEYWYRTETYWTTDSKGKRVQRTRQVRETEWWPLQGKYHCYYSGFMISGSRGLPQSEAERIKPYQLPALSRYQSYFLAGWLCEGYTVPPEEALEMSKQVFHERQRGNVAGFLPGDTHRDLAVETEYSHINSDLCLLPAYILSYRYGEKLYRFLINGQTGKVAGDKPLSRWRIATVVAAVLLLIGLLAVLIMLLRSL